MARRLRASSHSTTAKFPPRRRYITLSAFALQHLELAWDLARHTDPMKRKDALAGQIAVIKRLTEVLTYALLLTYGCIGIKKVAKTICSGASSFRATKGSGNPKAGNAAAPGRSSSSSLGIELQQSTSSSRSRDDDVALVVSPPTSSSSTHVDAQAAYANFPAGWARQVTAKGREYFFHEVSGETRWTPPPAPTEARLSQL